MIREFAPAKINLFLHVGHKRPDGYHELESLVVFASVGDELVLEQADTLSLDIEGPFASALGNGPDNLVLRAAHRYGELAQIPPCARITLTKNLPVASGIGGGSSDAAATLRGLSRLNPGRTNLQALWNVGAELGSDVPVSVLPGAWWMTGRGERFSNVSELPTFEVLLVNAGAPVSTAEAYAGLRERTGLGAVERPKRFSRMDDWITYLSGTRNDLEAPARALCPVIAEQLDALQDTGALLARMSGSGATCFGLYPDAPSARMAAESIARERPNWWLAPAKLNFGRKWEVQ